MNSWPLLWTLLCSSQGWCWALYSQVYDATDGPKSQTLVWIFWCCLHIVLFWAGVLYGSSWLADKTYCCYLTSQENKKQVTPLPGETGFHRQNSPRLGKVWKMSRGQDPWSIYRAFTKLQTWLLFYSRQCVALVFPSVLGQLHFFPKIFLCCCHLRKIAEWVNYQINLFTKWLVPTHVYKLFHTFF